jgi:hypothetical protein
MSIPSNPFDFPGGHRFFKKKRRGGVRKTRLRKHPIVRKKTARFRSRISPNPYLGSTTPTGQLFIESAPGNETFVPITAPRNDNLSYPFFKAESCRDELHGTPPWITGGPFRKINIEPVVPFGMQGHGSYYTNNWQNLAGYLGTVKYVGGFAPPDPFPGTFEDISISNIGTALGPNSLLPTDTSTLEAQAWDRTKPRLEQGGLVVAARESRDLMPMLRTSGAGVKQIFNMMQQLQRFHYIYQRMGGDLKHGLLKPRNVAGHFLNHNFGWVPFVKDISGTLDNIIFVDQKIRRLIDENNKDIRRRAKLFNHTEETKIADEENICLVSPGSVYYLQQCMIAPPRYEVWLERKLEVHTVGRFRYYVPEFDMSVPEGQGVLGSIKRQLTLHGARLTPMNIYRSTKWTWLLDWVSNSGRTLQAIQDQALDNMAATYLYLCHNETKTYKFRQILPFNARSGGIKTLEWSRVIEVKQRKEAEAPFGFGLSWEELTPKQLALLAAIGITRR